MLLEDEGGGRTDIYALYKIYCLSCVRAGGGGGGTDIYIPPPLVVTPTCPACHHGEQQQNITQHNNDWGIIWFATNKKLWIIVRTRRMFVCTAQRPIVSGGKQNKTKFQTLQTPVIAIIIIIVILIVIIIVIAIVITLSLSSLSWQKYCFEQKGFDDKIDYGKWSGMIESGDLLASLTEPCLILRWYSCHIMTVVMNDNLGESIDTHCMHASDSLEDGKYCG